MMVPNVGILKLVLIELIRHNSYSNWSQLSMFWKIIAWEKQKTNKIRL